MSRLAGMMYGFGNNSVSQTWNDLFLWDQTLNEFDVARIIELGTFTGGMATYLHIQALLRGADFISLDVNHYKEIRVERFDSRYLSHYWEFPFKQIDVRATAGIEFVGEMIRRPGLSVLFCDNGAKEIECEIYTPYLKPGDVLAVHDWGTECHHVPEELKLYTPIAEGIYEELESMTRFFTK